MLIDMCNVRLLEAWHGKLLAIGCATGRVGKPFTGYTLDLCYDRSKDHNIHIHY